MIARQGFVANLSRLYFGPLRGQILRRIEASEHGLASAPGG